MKTNVRQARVEDATDACNVIRTSILECCGEDHGGDDKVLQTWLGNKTPESLKRLIVVPSAFSYVARVDRATVGFASALLNGEVTLCYVSPFVRFTGVGKSLLAAIEDHATRAGVSTLRLESTRTALAFYLRNGFVSVGSPVSPFGIEAQPMKKELLIRE